MRNTKKAISILLTLLMVVGMMSTFAFAEGKTSTGFTITVTNAVEGQTYTAYKLFNISGKDGNAVTYYMNDTQYTQWGSILEGVGVTIGARTSDGKRYINTASMIEGEDSSATIKPAIVTALKNATKPADGVSVKASSSNVVLNVASAGYYFVDTTLGSLIVLNTYDNAVNIKDKNADNPYIEKKVVNDTNGYSYKLGDNVSYEVNVRTGGTIYTDYVLHDSMSSNLSLNEDSVVVKMKVGDASATSLVKDTDYTVNKGTCSDESPVAGCTFEIRFTDTGKAKLSANKNTIVTATYTAKVVALDDGTVANVLTNKISNEMGSTYKENSVDVYTGSVKVIKVDPNSTPLSGAEFVIRQKADDNTFKYLAKVDNAYTWVDKWENNENIVKLTSADNGETNTVYGLAKGLYELYEIKAPEDYNRLEDGISFTINGSTTSELAVTSTVENKKGSMLPETGGIGTTIFYLIGAILVIGAGVVFVTRRRMHSDK